MSEQDTTDGSSSENLTFVITEPVPAEEPELVPVEEEL